MAYPKAQTSDETKRLQQQMQSFDANKPAAFQDTNQSYMDNLLKQITNRKFSYDFNADPLYQQYKQQYTKLGNEAAMNAAANASALTGGYGNSYAATASAQANQQYLTELNNVIPQLYDAALNKYNMDTNDLYNQYGLYNDRSQQAYQQYRDTVNDYYTNRDYATNRYDNSVANDQWNSNYDYNAYQDELAQQNWQTQFDYGKAQDALAQQNWQTEFDYKKAADELAQNNWQTQFDYNKYMDAQNMAMQKEQNDRNNALAWAQENRLSAAQKLAAEKEQAAQTKEETSKQTENLAQSLFKDWKINNYSGGSNAANQKLVGSLKDMYQKKQISEEQVNDIIWYFIDSKFMSEDKAREVYNNIFHYAQ